MRIAEAQLVRAVGELQRTGGLEDAALAQAFVKLLRRKRLTRRIGKIGRALDAYAETASSTLSVVVTSAHPLALAERQSLESVAARLLGKPSQAVSLEFREDHAVIGGFRIEAADARYDGTVERALRELHKSL